jgi:hypothetical protein
MSVTNAECNRIVYRPGPERIQYGILLRVTPQGMAVIQRLTEWGDYYEVEVSASRIGCG